MYINEGITIFLILLFFCLVTIYSKKGGWQKYKNYKDGAKNIFKGKRLNIER